MGRVVCPGGCRFGALRVVPPVVGCMELQGSCLLITAAVLPLEEWLSLSIKMRPMPHYYVIRPYIATHNKCEHVTL